MYVVILAGGSGTRLWPWSRKNLPKQYLRLSDSGFSLFQDTVKRVKAAVNESNILVVSHRDQRYFIRRQLGELGLSGVTLLEEPRACNTAPAIGLAAWYLAKQAGQESIMAVVPADHLVTATDQFAALLGRGVEAAERYGLVTFGIQPAYPETGYGYICRGEPLDQWTYRVKKFVEKPSLEKARQYVNDGRYLWNSGIFVFKIGRLIAEYRRHLPETARQLDRLDLDGFGNIEAVYAKVEAISIDYGILEKSERVSVVPAGLEWTDLGSWEALYNVLNRDEEGNVLRGRVKNVNSHGCLVFSPKRLTAAVEVNDLVIVDSDDAVLVCNRRHTQDIKKLVERLEREEAPESRFHLTDYRPWGSYTVLEKSPSHQVKRITVDPGQRLSLQSHRFRAEHWVVVKGAARVTVDHREFSLKEGDGVYIPAGARHRLENTGDGLLEVIEVQTGSYLGEDDIERYEDDYNRR